MQIKRADFLQILSRVKSGLSSKERIDQSNSIVFTDGNIVTYNEDIMVMLPFDVDFQGAVRAEELLGILGKLKADTVDVSAQDGQVVIRAGRSKSGIRFEEEVRLPVQDVLSDYQKLDADNMISLPKTFLPALARARFCVAKGMNNIMLTGLYVHNGVVTASDNYRIIQIQTGSKAMKKLPEFLLPASCVEFLSQLEVLRIGISPSWAFFEGEDGLLFCVRLLSLDSPFPDVSRFFDVQGTEINLPAGLVEAIDKADIFVKSSVHEFDKQIFVYIKPNRVVLRGEGSFGWYEESVPAENEQQNFGFCVHPGFLRDILPHVHRAIVTDRLVVFEGDDFKHVFAISLQDSQEGN